MRARTWALAGGFVLGAGIGRLMAVGRRRRHERDLYHPRAEVRHAALHWLSRHPTQAVLALLSDWLAWEPLPVLQRRGTLVVSGMARAMGHGEPA